jgi:MATE family multidrug resistance protein
MSDSGSAPIDIEPDGRRHSVLSNHLPESLPVPSSFISTSEIVREILSRDIAECSSSDDDEAHGPDAELEAESEHSQAAADAKLAFHPNGVAFGCGYSAVPIQGLDRPVPNPHEIEESLQAELDLLRDNDIIPSKESRERRESLVGRFYQVFSTNVRDHEEATSPGVAAETTPLLQGEAQEIPATPPPEEIHERWEEAVAAQVIKTTWQREAKTLIQYSAPLIATFLLHYSVTIGSVLTVGRLGMVELAAVNRKYFSDSVNLPTDSMTPNEQ